MGKGKKFIMYLVLSIASIVSVFPLYYMFCASTNKSVDVIAGKLIPGTYLIENYKALIANQNLGLALWNSFRNATVLTVRVCWFALSPDMASRSITTKEKTLYLPSC